MRDRSGASWTSARNRTASALFLLRTRSRTLAAITPHRSTVSPGVRTSTRSGPSNAAAVGGSIHTATGLRSTRGSESGRSKKSVAVSPGRIGSLVASMRLSSVHPAAGAAGAYVVRRGPRRPVRARHRGPRLHRCDPFVEIARAALVLRQIDRRRPLVPERPDVLLVERADRRGRLLRAHDDLGQLHALAEEREHLGGDRPVDAVGVRAPACAREREHLGPHEVMDAVLIDDRLQPSVLLELLHARSRAAEHPRGFRPGERVRALRLHPRLRGPQLTGVVAPPTGVVEPKSRRRCNAELLLPASL